MRDQLTDVFDVAMARTWYEKAREFGSATASQRLELLAKGAFLSSAARLNCSSDWIS